MGTDVKLVADDGGEMTQELEDCHRDSLQELKDRVKDFGKHLWQAGLLGMPDDQDQPRIKSQGYLNSKVLEAKEPSALLALGNRPLHTSRWLVREVLANSNSQ